MNSSKQNQPFHDNNSWDKTV